MTRTTRSFKRCALLENRLSGLLPMEISLKADSPDLFYRADIYRKVAQLQQFAMEQKPVLFSRSYLDYFNEINRHTSTAGDKGRPDANSTNANNTGVNNTDQQSINTTRNFVMQEADEMRSGSS